MCGTVGVLARVAQRVVEDGDHHALQQLGIVEKIEWCRRICQVHGVDTAVALVFLREVEHVALVVLETLVRGHGVAVYSCQLLGVFLIACGEAVVIDLLVEVAAALHQCRIVFGEVFECLEDGLPVAGVIGLILLVHVFHVKHFVVAYHHEAAVLLRLAKVFHVDHQRHLCLIAAHAHARYRCGHLASFDKLCLAGFRIRDGDFAAVHFRYVEVAPVYRYHVAGGGERTVVLRSCLEVFPSSFGHYLGLGLVVHVVYCQLRGSGEIELHVLLPAVGRGHLIRYVVDGGGEHVGIVYQKR